MTVTTSRRPPSSQTLPSPSSPLDRHVSSLSTTQRRRSSLPLPVQPATRSPSPRKRSSPLAREEEVLSLTRKATQLHEKMLLQQCGRRSLSSPALMRHVTCLKVCHERAAKGMASSPARIARKAKSDHQLLKRLRSHVTKEQLDASATSLLGTLLDSPHTSCSASEHGSDVASDHDLMHEEDVTFKDMYREAEVCYCEGSVLGRKGDKDGALEMFTQALELNLNHAPALFALGLLLEEREDSKSAMMCFKRAATIVPNHVGALWHLGNLYLSFKQNIDKAAELFTRVVALNPEHSDAWISLASLQHHDLGQFEKAEESYLSALCLCPDDVDVHMAVASLYYVELNDLGAAHRHFTTALMLADPESDAFALAGAAVNEIERVLSTPVVLSQDLSVQKKLSPNGTPKSTPKSKRKGAVGGITTPRAALIALSCPNTPQLV
eukprot:m.65623 g.65623  ORF g.65623 m.65623 type:complete len:438 (+) comp12065_c1_seq1:446-1759(+)